MSETGDGGLLGQQSAAAAAVPLDDQDLHAGAGQVASADEAVMPAADNDSVVRRHGMSPLCRLPPVASLDCVILPGCEAFENKVYGFKTYETRGPFF